MELCLQARLEGIFNHLNWRLSCIGDRISFGAFQK